MTFDEIQKTIEGLLTVQIKQQENLNRLEQLAEKTLICVDQIREDLETQDDIKDVQEFHKAMARGEVELITWNEALLELEKVIQQLTIDNGQLTITSP